MALAERKPRRKFFVSVIDGPRRALVVGPYPTHKRALADVDAARRLCISLDPKAHFYAWGTASYQGKDCPHVHFSPQELRNRADTKSMNSERGSEMIDFKGKATIYRQNEMWGTISRIEVREVSIRRRKWAQYENAIEVVYLEKGKRKVRAFIESYKSHLLVIEGHGHPEPAGMFDGGRVDVGEEVTARHSKHAAFSGGYQADFDAMIAETLKGARVLWDTRGEEIR